MEEQAANAPVPVAPATQRHPIKFSASGSEYFRIWIVNLLLILVTLGIYLPWAKVRRLKYFYSNTWVDGDALDFHGDPRKMLRGLLLAAICLLAYSVGQRISGWAALAAALAFMALWPALFRASMRFRLANTSWRGLRFHFTGDLGGAYAALLAPIALLLVPGAVAGILTGTDMSDPLQVSPVALGVVLLSALAFVAALPYFFWRLRRYQHANLAWGSLQTELRCGPGSVYLVFLKLIGVTMLMGLVMALAIGLGSIAMGGGRGGGGFGWRILVGVLMALGAIVLINALPKAYLLVRLQNLFWTRTGNPQLRFVSELPLAPFLGLQLKNYLLIFLTLGLYWPFAVVATRRMQLEAVALHSRLPLDQITQTARREDPGATGDMAADLFGLDIGM